jgi:hypothetical protein
MHLWSILIQPLSYVYVLITSYMISLEESFGYLLYSSSDSAGIAFDYMKLEQDSG